MQTVNREPGAFLTLRVIITTSCLANKQDTAAPGKATSSRVGCCCRCSNWSAASAILLGQHNNCRRQTSSAGEKPERHAPHPTPPSFVLGRVEADSNKKRNGISKTQCQKTIVQHTHTEFHYKFDPHCQHPSAPSRIQGGSNKDMLKLTPVKTDLFFSENTFEKRPKQAK